MADKKSGSGCGTAVLLSLIITGAIYGYQNKGAATSVTETRPVIDITITGYQQAWLENELAAKQRFSHSRVRIVGEARRVLLTRDDEPVLEINFPDQSRPWTIGFVKEDQQKLANIRPGQPLSVVCVPVMGNDPLDRSLRLPQLAECRLEA